MSGEQAKGGHEMKEHGKVAGGKAEEPQGKEGQQPPKVRYSDEELEYFKRIILEKLERAKADLADLKAMLTHSRDNDTWSIYHPTKFYEENQELLTRDEISRLVARQEKYIKHLEAALIRIENKTYGICRVTGKLIPKERLELVPHATLSLEAKMMLAQQKGQDISSIGE